MALHTEKQDELRKEVSQFANGGDPSYDQLMALPYLDAVFREILRLHPPVEINVRVVRYNFNPITVKL